MGKKAEKLSWSEIEKKYPDEWVLIDNPKTDRDLNIITGTVAAHGADRELIDRAAKKSKAKRIAILYTGGMRNDIIYVL